MAGCSGNLLDDQTEAHSLVVENTTDGSLTAAVTLARRDGETFDRRVEVPAGERRRIETEVANDASRYRLSVESPAGTVSQAFRVNDPAKVVGFFVEVSESGVELNGLRFSGDQPQPVALDSFTTGTGPEGADTSGNASGDSSDNTT